MTESRPESRFDRDTALTSARRRSVRRAHRPRLVDRARTERRLHRGDRAAGPRRSRSDDPSRTPRSLTVHYLAPPREGPCEMHTRVERTGRRVTFVTGRLVQGERLLALAMAAFAVSMDGPGVRRHRDARRAAARSGRAAAVDADAERRNGRRRCASATSSGGRSAASPSPSAPVAVVGGYIRFADEVRRPIDHLAVTAFADAWIPSVFARFPQPMGDPDGRPHRPLPRTASAPDHVRPRLLPRRVPHPGGGRRLRRGGRRGVESRRHPPRPLPPARRAPPA